MTSFKMADGLYGGNYQYGAHFLGLKFEQNMKQILRGESTVNESLNKSHASRVSIFKNAFSTQGK